MASSYKIVNTLPHFMGLSKVRKVAIKSVIAEDSPLTMETSMKCETSNAICEVSLMLLFLVVVAPTTCASRPINLPIDQVDPNSG